MKSRIVEQLGQTEVLLPSLVAAGLAANDRIKVRLSALQAAAQHARLPNEPPIDLSAECRAAGLESGLIQRAVSGARTTAGGKIAVPNLAALHNGIREDMAAMVEAVAAGSPSEGMSATDRLAAIGRDTLSGSATEIELAEVAKLTGVSSDAGSDSLHRLVMDLHKSLNRLAADCAEEVVAGAHVFGLHPEDKSAVEAFMHGLARTRALKFDHPGLDTTATRSGPRLIIQNDIGATDAHVIVINVEGCAVTVTYTDVHLARAKFFTGLFDEFPLQWSGLDRKSADGLGDDGVFYLVTGRFEAESEKKRDAFLEALGAALVFLIDWNKARKVLRLWMSKGDAVRALDWAARNGVGHRAFLELGGSDLVAAAVRHATPTRIGFGERLDDALGREPAFDFVTGVLRISAAALLDGQSIRLVRDRVEAELVRHLARADRALLATIVRQTGLARDIAAAIGQHIADQQSGRSVDRKLLALRARRIEEKADKIAVDARSEIARLNADSTIEQLVNRAEDTIDQLEQAAFVASAVPENLDAKILQPLSELCAAVIEGAEAAARGVDAAAEVQDGRRVDSEDALAAVGRLIDIEHRADASERDVTSLVLSGGFDFRTSLAALELARAMERATDLLASFGHLLRRHVLADLTT
jgi:uncharacterized protein Yka (UPF0111/DUF47 family)